MTLGEGYDEPLYILFIFREGGRERKEKHLSFSYTP